ncbi:MAG: hypothetical protein ACYDEP_07870 [Acidimicrobiales bacterium]
MLGPEPGGVVLHHHLIVVTNDPAVFVVHARQLYRLLRRLYSSTGTAKWHDDGSRGPQNAHSPARSSPRHRRCRSRAKLGSRRLARMEAAAPTSHCGGDHEEQEEEDPALVAWDPAPGNLTVTLSEAGTTVSCAPGSALWRV